MLPMMTVRMEAQPRSPSLSQLLAEYKRVTGQSDPGPRFRNNAAWLQKKIDAVQNPTFTETGKKKKYSDMRGKADYWIAEFEPIISKLERVEALIPPLAHDKGTNTLRLNGTKRRKRRWRAECKTCVARQQQPRSSTTSCWPRRRLPGAS
eukprot:SAG22_NODE_45_length_24718_cov_12.462448_12_plen_150_part_00